MNIQPELYDQSNDLQRKDSQYIYDHLKKDFADKKIELLVDIGCGTGNITVEICKCLESEKTIGIDLSSTMVNYANLTYKTDKLTFKVADICSDWEQLAKDLGITEGSVDVVTSTYCLHWVSNSTKAMKNIYKMLKPGGISYLLMFSWSQILPIQEQITFHPRWADLFRKALETENNEQIEVIDTNSKQVTAQATPPLPSERVRRKSSAPFPVFEIPPEGERIKIWRDLCKSADLKLHNVQVHDSTFTYENIQGFQGELKSLCHYLVYIPQEQREQFMVDYFEHMHNCFIAKQDNLPKVHVDYQFLTVIASKPN